MTSNPTHDDLTVAEATHVTSQFVCPARFGRRKADQVGQLIVTASSLTFRGALDVSIAWTQVADVQRAGTEVVIALRDTPRPLRFCCAEPTDAAQAAALAVHFAGV